MHDLTALINENTGKVNSGHVLFENDESSISQN